MYQDSETLPEFLKVQIADAIVENFLKGDVADALMGLAYDETKPYVNPDNQDLISEVSGMVGYKIAELIKAGASAWAGSIPDVPSPQKLQELLESQGWRQASSYGSILYIFGHPDYPGRQMVFPVDATAPDYVESAQSVLQKLSQLQSFNTGAN